jgi:hypothetical protein
LIYNIHKTFPTKQAIQAATDKKLPTLQKQLVDLRATQLSNKESCPESSYALLRKFSCIADVSKQQCSPYFISDYAGQLAWSVIKNIRYSS